MDDLKLLKNTLRRINSANIDAISFLKGNDEICINYEELIRRAEELDVNYGYDDALWLLEHRKEIPMELEKFGLVFPGTIWHNERFNLNEVSWMYKNDDGLWVLRFRWLDTDWDSSVRFVSPRKESRQ